MSCFTFNNNLPSSVQSLSRVRLCNPMNRSTPGLPVHHQLPEFTQTRVHRVGDAIQPSHPLSSPFPPAPNPSQHQNIFSFSVRGSLYVVINVLASYIILFLFIHSVVSDCLLPHEWQHARPPYPSPTPGVHSDSHPSSR